MTLGEFIAKLKAENSNNIIQFDFGGLYPGIFDSYRGYYDELALDWSGDYYESTIKSLIEKSEACLEKVFVGYKGGDYKMNELTKLWVAKYGETSGTVIKDIANYGWGCIILTGYEE